MGRNVFRCEFFVQGFIYAFYALLMLILRSRVDSCLIINVKWLIFDWTTNVSIYLEDNRRFSTPLPHFRIRTSFSFFLLQCLKLLLNALIVCLHKIKLPYASYVGKPVFFLLQASTSINHIRQTLVMTLGPLRD